MLTGTTIAEINAMTSTRIYERKLIDGGYATLLVEQDNPGESTLSTTTCRILEAINGVSASVSMRRSRIVHPVDKRTDPKSPWVVSVPT